MFPKSHENLLEFAYHSPLPNRTSPHVVYANLEFVGPKIPKGSLPLLRFIEGLLPDSWTVERTLRFLKQHQAEFRACLYWLSEDSRVDFGPIEDDYDEFGLLDRWRELPEVKFLQRHGLDHGGVALAPRSFDPIYPYQGLEIEQKEAVDPLDPICWYMLSLLTTYGTVFVRRCGYLNCGKFYWPRTRRKLFCNDVCRAQQHALRKFAEDPKKFWKGRADYMKKNRLDHNILRKAKTSVVRVNSVIEPPRSLR